MEIKITKGRGTGDTYIAAFDAALKDAGVLDYNLIILSSVIPAGSQVTKRKPEHNSEEIGHRLYVVMSRSEADASDASTYAGVGWAQRKDGSGVFVEEHGHTDKEVNSKITASLDALIEHRQGLGDAFISRDHLIERAEYNGKPACALVVAVYKSEPW